MAVNPFIATEDLYNPFRQSGDAGGSLYGKRREDLGGSGPLGPTTTANAPVPQAETMAAPTALSSPASTSETGRDDGGYLSSERQIADFTGGVDRTNNPEGVAEANPYDDMRDAVALDDFFGGSIGYDDRGFVSQDSGLGSYIVSALDSWTGGLLGLGINVATGINKSVQREDMHEYIAKLQSDNRQDEIEHLDTTKLGPIDYDARQAGREGLTSGGSNVLLGNVTNTVSDIVGPSKPMNASTAAERAAQNAKSRAELRRTGRGDRDGDRSFERSSDRGRHSGGGRSF